MKDHKVWALLQKIDNGYEQTATERQILATHKKLDLSVSNINQIPDSLGQLKSLQYLNLRKTSISALPDSLGQLKSLQYLDLSETGISVLPDSIGRLDSLQSLDLSYTPISALPDSLGHLKSLLSLNLGHTCISALPNSLKQLKNLQCLSLCLTPISALPDFLEKLDSLQSLNLSSTYINALPDSLGQFSNLQTLYLGGTSISSLPDSLGKLDSLMTLNLNNTNIKEFPESIKDLSHLKHLDLSNCTFLEIPEFLLSFNLDFKLDLFPLNNKSGIIIYNLKLQKQPVSLFHQPRKLIRKYYDSKKIEINEAKVIFMGDGGAGKSHTIQRIKNNGTPLEKDTEVTHNITIEHWDNPERIVDFDGAIDFWDFGGQDIYLSMHRCFLTERSCYVIVLCNRQYGSPRGLMRQARYWLKTISSFAKDSPILIAVNTWKGQNRDGISLTQLKKHLVKVE